MTFKLNRKFKRKDDMLFKRWIVAWLTIILTLLPYTDKRSRTVDRLLLMIEE